MHFVWIGYLKPGIDQIPPSLQLQGTDFLSQPVVKILAAGPLREATGKRTAMMMVFEHRTRDDAQQFVKDSPYLLADLYEDHRLYEYDNEVG